MAADLPFRLPVPVALARPTESLEVLSAGRAQYSPKFDGFRALYGRGRLYSRRGTDLTRYFPELVPLLSARISSDVILDGELCCWDQAGRRLDFAALSRRLTAGRGLAQLAARRPAHLVCFDLLATDGRDLRPLPLRERTRMLEQTLLGLSSPIELCQTTTDLGQARHWMSTLTRAGIEGVVIKDLDGRYPTQSERVWFKHKARSTLDLVVSAVIGDPGAPTVLVLSLPTADGLFQVGVTTVLARSAAREVGRSVRTTGASVRYYATLPGAQDLTDAAAVEPFVVEVDADVAIDNGRLRHGARLRRARPDLTPDDLLPPATVDPG